jgi:hypothetical protein
MDPITFAEARLSEDEQAPTVRLWGQTAADSVAAARRRERDIREAAAGRRILRRHRNCMYGGGYCGDGGHGGDLLCPELADLLVRWADHPEYEQAWKPEA